MVFVGVGGNLPAEGMADALATCRAAVAALPERGLRVARASPWYESAPVPASDQPPYVNAVLRIETGLDPAETLRALHAVEAAFGRRRGAANAARTVDLDLLDYGGRVHAPDSWPLLPHPRMHLRAFVLRPLGDICPGWRHPRLGTPLAELAARLPPGQRVRRLAD